MILSDRDIVESIIKKTISIEPFDAKNLTPNGYDLTIDEIFIDSIDKNVKSGEIEIPPKTWFLVSTKEYVKIPGEIACQLWIRTTYARKGIIPSFGMIDSGFEGTLTLSAFNSSDKSVKISIGERFAQVVFLKLISFPQSLYEQRSGNYMRQKGITMK